MLPLWRTIAKDFVRKNIVRDKIQNRKDAFVKETGLKHTPWITLITTEGIAKGKYSQMVQSQITLDDLFKVWFFTAKYF